MPLRARQIYGDGRVVPTLLRESLRVLARKCVGYRTWRQIMMATVLRALGLIAVVALGVRLAYVALQSAFSFIDASFIAGDSVLYLELGRSIAAGQGMSLGGSPTAYVGPGYPVFVAAAMKVGLDPLGIGLVQAVLGAGTAVFVALAARELAAPQQRTSWTVIAGLAAATYPHLVFWTGYVLTETLFVFLVTASLVALLLAVRRESLTLAALAGVSAAAASLTRPPFLAIAVVIAAWWILLVLRQSSARRAILPLLFIIAAAVPLAAWTVRNAALLDTPIVTTTESGHVFYQGNSRTSNGGSRGYVDQRDFRPLDLPPGMTEVESDAAYLHAALEDIRADPLGRLALWPAKAWNMWRPTYEGASLRNGLVTLVTYVPVLILGLIGAVQLARRDILGTSAVPLATLLVWVFIHLVVTGMIRFRLPAEAVLLMTLPAGIETVRNLRTWLRR